MGKIARLALLVVLSWACVAQANGTAVPVRAGSGYGQGTGSGTWLFGSNTFSSNGVTLNETLSCPASGPDINNQCDFLFFYQLGNIPSGTSSLTLTFSNLSNFDFNSAPLFGGGTSPFGMTSCDLGDPTTTPQVPCLFLNPSSFPSASAAGGTGSISFTILNPVQGLTVYFIDTTLTTLTCQDPTNCPGSPFTNVPAIPNPTITVLAATPEPVSALLFASGAALLGCSRRRRKSA